MENIDLSAPSQPHDIAKEIYHLYGGEKPGIGDKEVAALQNRLNQIYPELQEAYHAILAIMGFSEFLKQNNDAASADQLMRLARAQRRHFEPIQHLLPDPNSANATQFTRLISSKVAPKRAPELTAKAPEGSLKASAFVPNPALRQPRRPTK